MHPDKPSVVLRDIDADALLVTNLTNIFYLTGLTMSAGILLVTRRSWKLHIYSLYEEMAERCAPHGVTLCSMDDLGKSLASLKRVAFDADDVTVARLRRWKRQFKNTKFIHSSGVIESFRRQKSDSELRHFYKAQRITREMMRRVPVALRTGVTERDIAWKLRAWAQELGADELSFDAIVAFGTHSARPHHEPTHRKLKQGHVVQIDVGVKVKGYCSDQSRVFFAGRPTALQQRVYDAVSEAKDAAVDLIAPGVTTHTLDQAARDVLASYDFEEYFTHSLGHGLGLDVHESPTLSIHGTKQKLRAGEIITIEPGVYLPGKFGIRLEDEYVVE